MLLLLRLCSAGFSFQVTPAKSSLKSFTPSKAMLMGHETKMNMISPLASSSLFHTDIETGEAESALEWQCGSSQALCRWIAHQELAGVCGVPAMCSQAVFLLSPPTRKRCAAPGVLERAPAASSQASHSKPTLHAGKVISEWSFQKDGVDVPIKDIVTDNKAAQVRALALWPSVPLLLGLGPAEFGVRA